MRKISKKKRLTALLTMKRWDKIRTYAEENELSLTSIIERFIDEHIPDIKEEEETKN